MSPWWIVLAMGCGLTLVSIPLTIVVVIWTGRQQWNRDSWLLLPMAVATLAVVLLVGGGLMLVQAYE